MNEIARLIFAVLLPTAFGFTLFATLTRKKLFSFPLCTALSIGLGFGLLAQWMLILRIVNIPYSILTIAFLPIMIIISLGAMLFNNPTPFTFHCKTARTTSKFVQEVLIVCSTLIILYILYNTFFVFYRALTIPIREWDALSTIAFKAKIFFYQKELYLHSNLPHSSYPLYTPFTLTWIAFVLGEWHEIFVKVVFPITFLAYISIHYSFTRLFTNNQWAFYGIALLISSNFFLYHATIAYRDFSMMFYNCTSILLLIMCLKQRDNTLLVVAGIFSGLTTFVKLEGTGYLLIHLFIGFFVCRNLAKKSLKTTITYFFQFSLPGIIICFTYYAYKAFYHISSSSNRFSSELVISNLERLVPIFLEFTNNLFLSGNWHIIWAFLFGGILFNYKKRLENEVKYLLLSITLFFILYTIIALFTPNFVSIAGKESSTVLSRLILHFYPLAPLTIILLMAPRIDSENRACH